MISCKLDRGRIDEFIVLIINRPHLVLASGQLTVFRKGISEDDKVATPVRLQGGV